METVCQASYPLNSEKASPPGTCTVYLASPASCAVMTLPPRTASTTAPVSVSRDVILFMALLLPQTRLMVTSMLPRVALEYGQVWCAASTSFCATSRSRPGRLTLSRARRK